MKLAILVAILVFCVPARAEISVILPGSFHGDEVPNGTAGDWYALVIDDKGATLRRVRVSVEIEEDALLDEGDRKTGRRVETNPRLEIEPAILVRGIKGLAAGRVPTVATDKTVEPASPLDTRLGANAYRFIVKCSATSPVDGQNQEDCDLRVQAGAADTSLFVYHAYEQGQVRYWAAEYPPTIVWAGDIDGDGRLDVLLDTSDHYNAVEMRLYLSTAAKSGALLKEAARFLHVGC